MTDRPTKKRKVAKSSPERRIKRDVCPCNWPNCQDLYERLPAGDIWKGRNRPTLVLFESVTRNLGIQIDPPAAKPNSDKPDETATNDGKPVAADHKNKEGEPQMQQTGTEKQPVQCCAFTVSRHHWTRAMNMDHFDNGKRYNGAHI